MTVSGIISAIIVGAIIGALGRLLVKGKQKISIIVTILLGIVAALIGTWLAQIVGVATTDGIDWIEIVLQVALAAVLVVVYTSVAGRRS
ncbi:MULTISPECIES: GlsB/YeaQ/YmgE family stress response membrane protein [Cellulomonas]|uniref:Transglycosylase n=1 Tax=Cellulomonas oligotrophica TaxID=931536 RepID=A0A7Y9FI90_9CELL|nr:MULTISPECIES: GlsB/YeaQ/YmgE family stress response membrane protein [Cellulomonas]NYD87412.1 putative membrane protein YeaQ/YmgE (transglycosylase-associated protein family) [Cellulomonas oligotrophica]TQL01477.1 putative membrane protein YeaQ/YmgE (transglycosylase-associated protein family) [Cellulomonas sp. SLBN-39]GIG34110.1 transglycosylase [Cellulomonas oligotrophica]